MYRYRVTDNTHVGIEYANEQAPDIWSPLVWIHDMGQSFADLAAGRPLQVKLEADALVERLNNQPHPDVLPYVHVEGPLVIIEGVLPRPHPSGLVDYSVRLIMDRRGKVIARVMGNVGADKLVEHLNRPR